MSLYRPIPEQMFDAIQHPENAAPELLYTMLFFRFQQLLDRDHLCCFGGNGGDVASENRWMTLYGEAMDLVHLLGDQVSSCAIAALVAFGKDMDPDTWRVFLYGEHQAVEGIWRGVFNGAGYFSLWAMELPHSINLTLLLANGSISEN